MKRIVSLTLLFALLFTPSVFAEEKNLYVNNEYSYTVVIPDGWKITNQTPVGIDLKKPPETLFPRISICALPNHRKPHENEVFKKDKNEINTMMVKRVHLYWPKATILDSGETTLSNRQALWLLYSIDTSDFTNSVPIHVYALYYHISDKDNTYEIFFNANISDYEKNSIVDYDKLDSHRKSFDELLESFTIVTN